MTVDLALLKTTLANKIEIIRARYTLNYLIGGAIFALHAVLESVLEKIGHRNSSSCDLESWLRL